MEYNGGKNTKNSKKLIDRVTNKMMQKKIEEEINRELDLELEIEIAFNLDLEMNTDTNTDTNTDIEPMINFEIAFLWINTELKVIDEINKMNIISTIIRCKQNNPLINIYLYLDYLYTKIEDLAYFVKFNFFTLQNIRDIETVKYSIEIEDLLRIDKPQFIRSDIAKILIQYDRLLKNLNEEYYIIVSDMEIITKLKSSKKQDFKQNKIFDLTTKNLLNTFGYVIINNTQKISDISYIIMKNDSDIIMGLKDIFIDKVMVELLFNMFRRVNVLGLNDTLSLSTTKITSLNKLHNILEEFISNCYYWFTGYINILKKYILLKVLIDKTIVNLSFINDKYIEHTNYNEAFVVVNNKDIFWLINNNLKIYNTYNHLLLYDFSGKCITFSFSIIYLTALGRNMIEKNKKYIYSCENKNFKILLIKNKFFH